MNALEIETVRQLPPGSNVLVFREKEGWKQYTLAKVDGNNVNVILPSGLITAFGIHNVRPFVSEDSKMVPEKVPIVVEENMVSNTVPCDPRGICRGPEDQFTDGPASRTRSRVRFAAESRVAIHEDPVDFRDSRMKELNDLQEIGCFEIVDESEANGHRIYRHSFVDKVKYRWTEKVAILCCCIQ